MSDIEKNPLFETIKAMKRLKKRQKATEARQKIIEKAIHELAGVVSDTKARNESLETGFQRACEHADGGPFRAFYEQLKAAEEERGEERGEEPEGDGEEYDDEEPGNPEDTPENEADDGGAQEEGSGTPELPG